MRHLFSLFFLFFTYESIGQSFSLPELEAMSKMDASKFDTFVYAKGYKFIGTEDSLSVNGNGFKYAYDFDTVTKKALSFITFYPRHSPRYRCIINYFIISQSEYLKIKNEIEEYGLEFVGSLPSRGNSEGIVQQNFVYMNKTKRYDILISTYLSKFNVMLTFEN